MSQTEIWMDYVAEINDHTAHILTIYKTERNNGNQSPWLPVAMMEGARITADASRAVVDLLGRNEEPRRIEWPVRRLLECRNALRKVSRMMDDMFVQGNQSENNA